jgi:hypothetical protein
VQEFSSAAESRRSDRCREASAAFIGLVPGHELGVGFSDLRLQLRIFFSDSDLEIRYRRKDGSVFWASIYISPVRDEGGDVVQHFASFVDLTKHKQEKDRLRFLLDELNHRTQNTLATVQAIAVQTLRGEGFWLPSAPRRGLWCMCGHVCQRKRARKTVTPLLRDRVAVFDESDISESCLELDPNAKVSG